MKTNASEKEKKRKEIIEAGGGTETLLILALNKAISSEKDDIAKKNIKSCIECLQQRNQSWNAISAKFVISDEAFKQKIRNALSK